MKSDARWIAMWVWRVVANALAGGLAFSLVGALCGGAAGFVVGFAMSADLSVIGALYGATIGLPCGIAGVFVHAVGAVFARPDDELLKPCFDLTARVSQGQLWGTIAACTAFLGFAGVRALVSGATLAQIANQDLALAIVGAPVSMICGAVAFALLKRD